MSRKEALSQFIQQIHGRPVVVKLNSGVDYRGRYLFTRYHKILYIGEYCLYITILFIYKSNIDSNK